MMLESSQGGEWRIDRLISSKEAAKMLGIAHITLWRWIVEGKFPGVKIGRLWKVKEADVEAYIEEHTHRPHEEPR